MPVITHSDYLLQVSGTGLIAVPGVWVRLLNNSTLTNYYSTAVTASTGAFTHSAVPGDYSAFYGTAATVPGTPTLANAHWAVPVTAGDDAVLGSATLVVSSPYTPYAGPAEGIFGQVFDRGGAVINMLHPKYRALGTWDPVAGTGNFVTAYNQAITDAGSGGAIYFPPGTYVYTGNLNLATNVGLIGSGWTSILKKGATAGLSASGLSNVRIANLKLDGSGWGFDILKFSGASNCIVEECWFLNPDTASQAVALGSATTGTIIRNNWFTASVAAGGGVTIQDANSSNNQVINNYLASVGTATASQIWIQSASCNSNLIQGNTCVSNALGYGIAVATGALYNRVIGNHVGSHGISGLLITGNFSIVQGNECINNGLDGIDAGNSSYSILTGNYCFGNQLNGIEINAYTTASFGCLVANNICQQNSKNGSGLWDGIVVQSASGLACQSHIITANRCFDDAGTKLQRYGINELNGSASATDKNLYLGNMVSGNLTGGISTLTGPTSMEFANQNTQTAIEFGSPIVLNSRANPSTDAPPTQKGDIRILNAGSGNATPGGLEFLGSSFTNGYGYRLTAYSSGSDLPLAIQFRANNATWSDSFRWDLNGHLVSTLVGTPATSALGANVTSVTFTGNDHRGKIVIVMSGALAANTRIATCTWGATFFTTTPLPQLTNQTSGAGLAIVNFYSGAESATAFDLFANQALAAGTYTVRYVNIG